MEDVTKFPGTVGTIAAVGGNVASWSNVDNVKEEDDVYATALGGFGEDPTTYGTNTIKPTNFGFEIPLDATILGIEVTISRKSSHNAGGNISKDLTLVLNKSDDTAGSQSKADTGTNWPTSEAERTYGGDDDLWDEEWTPEDINSSNFGIRFRGTVVAQSASVTLSVDSFSITVYYSLPEPDPGTPTFSQKVTSALTLGVFRH